MYFDDDRLIEVHGDYLPDWARGDDTGQDGQDEPRDDEAMAGGGLAQ